MGVRVSASAPLFHLKHATVPSTISNPHFPVDGPHSTHHRAQACILHTPVHACTTPTDFTHLYTDTDTQDAGLAGSVGD